MTKEQEALPGTAEKVVGVIPFLFYDLIARVVPGTAFLLALVWYRTDIPPLAHSLGDAVKVLLILGAGYGMGIILTGLANIFDGAWLLIAWLGDRWDYPKRQEYRLLTPEKAHNISDRVWKENRLAGDRLLKTFAEVTLCENLLCGFILLWISKSWTSETIIQQLSTGWEWAICMLLLVALVFRVIAYSAMATSYKTIYLLQDEVAGTASARKGAKGLFYKYPDTDPVHWAKPDRETGVFAPACGQDPDSLGQEELALRQVKLSCPDCQKALEATLAYRAVNPESESP